MLKKGKKWGHLFLATSLVFHLAGGSAAMAADVMGTGGSAVGFIFVGAKDDLGYNQAAYLGSQGVEKAFPKMKMLRAENVPETGEAERVMEEMIRNGARIIFPTSYGHLEPAMNVAKRHPEVVFYHQGGLKTSNNLGTYFGTIWEGVYLAGIAAGKMSKSGKLGFIGSVPIPALMMNVNAFHLGAKSVNPKVSTTVIFTGSWCDPGQQANASNSLIDQGIDVLTQHQDCTKTVIETAEKRGMMSVGYHADASAIAPKGWLIGSTWDWREVYADMVKLANDGKFKGSKYDARYRAQIVDGIIKLTKFGNSVPKDVQDLVLKAEADIKARKIHPFKGPINDNKGKTQVKAGEIPPLETLESMRYFAEGVIGNY